MGKQIKISISKSAIFREEWLRATLAHEIDTHLVRYLNGIKSWRNIFKSWTGHYAFDEEWLAIWNGNKVLPDDYEKISLYKKYVVTHELQKFTFSKAVEFVKFIYPDRSLEWIFKTVIRSKKWIIHTENIWVWYLKDKTYLDGFTKVKQWIDGGNTPDKMYKWKLKIEDLEYIQ
jgi:hypothetical protein